MLRHLEKFGTIGLFVTAFASACCFPLFGIVITSLGFGASEIFGDWTIAIFQILVGLSFVGIVITYFQNHKITSLLIGCASAILIFYAYYIDFRHLLIYIGMFGFLIASGLNYYSRKAGIMCETCEIDGKKVFLTSIITCPQCGFQKEETMPTNACQFFYKCLKCDALLKPKAGDCCVFCSFGSMKCPPMQLGTNCC